MGAVEEEGETDMEAWEFFIREAVLAAGAEVLSRLLGQVVSKQRGKPVICECGARMRSRGLRERTISTILGIVRFHRPVFKCSSCGKTLCPMDDALGISRTKHSPALTRLMARSGAATAFGEASKDLKLYASVDVCAKSVERVAETVGERIGRWSDKEGKDAVKAFQDKPMEEDKTIPCMYIELDGTGIPMTKTELAGRKGKQPDGTARTREVKVGCVFTQTAVDDEGRPVRDPDSTTFTAQIETAEQFGQRLFQEAVRRGMGHAEELVVLGDGAAWIHNLVETHFPRATQIIDLYHAKEHVSDLCKALCPYDKKKLHKLRLRWWTELEEGGLETIIKEARRRLPKKNNERRRQALKQIAYMTKNKKRMRYKTFRNKGLFVGSGVVEAACKSVIGQRLKQSGMEWSLSGANAIISLRCMERSNRTDDFWETYLAS